MPSSSSRDIPKSLIFRVFLSVTRQLRAARSLRQPQAISPSCPWGSTWQGMGR